MQITLNGKKLDVDINMKLMDLLAMKGLEPERIVIEYNGELMKKEEWTAAVLKEGDTLEILRFVGGG